MPGTLTIIPSSTPAGMLISTTSSPFTTPVPPHSLHLFLIIVPSPLQVGHSDCVCIIPNTDLTVRATTPRPLHVGQVSGVLPPSAPEPWQHEHVMSFLTLNFLVTPEATSCSESLTFSLRSAPLNWARLPPPSPNPPKPPNPECPPNTSPNIEKMSSIENPPPKPPEPPKPLGPLKPNWSYCCLFCGSWSTS